MKATAVIFDSLGTLFELEPMRPKLQSIGLAPRELEVWLARTFRDGIALSATGTYRHFQEVASSALMTLVAELGQRPDPAKVDEVVSAFAELPAAKDLKPAFAQLTQWGSRLAVITNASAEVGRSLLKGAGALELVERVISTDEVGHWKPFPQVFHHATHLLNLEAKKIAYVSGDAWEVQGARNAGLFGVLLQRRGGHHQPAMPPPDLTIAGLAELAQIGLNYDPNA